MRHPRRSCRSRRRRSGARAVCQKDGDDPALLFLGDVRARVARARVLDCKVQRGRTAPVHQRRVCAVLDERGDRVRAARPNGSMQGRHAAFVSRVGIGACVDQIGDHFALCGPVPPAPSRAPVCRVVDRFGAPAVASPDICAPTDEGLGEVSPVSGGRDVQSRVARVDVVLDRGKKVRSRSSRLAPIRMARGRERRRRVEPSSDVRLIP